MLLKYHQRSQKKPFRSYPGCLLVKTARSLQRCLCSYDLGTTGKRSLWSSLWATWQRRMVSGRWTKLLWLAGLYHDCGRRGYKKKAGFGKTRDTGLCLWRNSRTPGAAGEAASPKSLTGDTAKRRLRHPLFIEPGQGHQGLLLDKKKTDMALLE